MRSFQFMGKSYSEIPEITVDWIRQQKLFFVSTAPLSSSGHVNCSPKGYDSFRIIDNHTVAYQDLTGSGAETIAHLQENGRITIMFCAFEGPPKIVRLYGIGEVIREDEQRFAELASLFPAHRGMRAVIVIHISRVADSCGYGVPEYGYLGSREQLDKWTNHKTDEEIESYRKEKNSQSIDGLPGL